MLLYRRTLPDFRRTQTLPADAKRTTGGLTRPEKPTEEVKPLARVGVPVTVGRGPTGIGPVEESSRKPCGFDASWVGDLTVRPGRVAVVGAPGTTLGADVPGSPADAAAAPGSAGAIAAVTRISAVMRERQRRKARVTPRAADSWSTYGPPVDEIKLPH